MITRWLSFSLSSCATNRAMISGAPPAPNGTISEIGRAGHGWAWAAAKEGDSTRAIHVQTRLTTVTRIMWLPLQASCEDHSMLVWLGGLSTGARLRCQAGHCKLERLRHLAENPDAPDLRGPLPRCLHRHRGA